MRSIFYNRAIRISGYGLIEFQYINMKLFVSDRRSGSLTSDYIVQFMEVSYAFDIFLVPLLTYLPTCIPAIESTGIRGYNPKKDELKSSCCIYKSPSG